jgi:hypothetical protein
MAGDSARLRVKRRNEPRGRASSRLTGGYGPLGEAEHVGTLRMFGATVAFVERELAVGVNLPLESLEKFLTRGPGSGASILGATP